MYTIADGLLTAALPAGWSPQEVSAMTLFGDGRQPAKFSLDGRCVTVEMQARRPVMLYRAESRLA